VEKGDRFLGLNYDYCVYSYDCSIMLNCWHRMRERPCCRNVSHSIRSSFTKRKVFISCYDGYDKKRKRQEKREKRKEKKSELIYN
jgi:hypothetical protein